MVTHSIRIPVMAASLLALATAGCRDEALPTGVSEQTPSFSATTTPVAFTVGRLTLNAMSVLRPDGRFHLRDVALSGPVSGDVTGTAQVTLEANLDKPGGSGPAWGTMTIVTTGGDVWQGALVGNFQGYGPGAIQLSSRVVLNGPEQQSLRAECNETTPTSETLVCSGEILTVHD